MKIFWEELRESFSYFYREPPMFEHALYNSFQENYSSDEPTNASKMGFREKKHWLATVLYTKISLKVELPKILTVFCYANQNFFSSLT